MSLQIDEPVGHTCPKIDEVIKGITWAVSEMSTINNVLESNAIGSALSEINGLESTMEEIRTANEKLRSWGNDLNDNICYLEEQLEKLNKE